MKLKECLEKVSSLSVIRKYATAIVDNRNEKDTNQIEIELLDKLDTILRSVQNNLNLLEKDRLKRILKPIIIKIILEERNYRIKSKNLYEKVIAFEQSILKDGQNDLFNKNVPKANLFDIYYTILEGAWKKDNDITEDEENILQTLRKKMNITLEEHWMLQSKLGIFPKPYEDGYESNFHTAEEIKAVARALQSEHLLLLIIGEDKDKYFVIPEEIADVIKKGWGIQLSKKAYLTLLGNKQFFNKERCLRILQAVGIKPKQTSNKALINSIINNVKPIDALHYFVPKNELGKELEKMCFAITNWTFAF
ncbi:MAG: hypothetical protein KAU14_09055 [Thermoplasmata archaeon]|nr:hypothetical protein [Thermoplasmata archaeon]